MQLVRYKAEGVELKLSIKQVVLRVLNSFDLLERLGTARKPFIC